MDEALRKQREADEAFAALGFKFAELPKTVRDQRLGAEFDKWGKHIDAAVEAGADLNFTIGKAGPELSKLVDVAAKTGTEIPEHMRPILQQAVALGVLVDENGNKITDLNALGIAFGDTYKTNGEKVKTAMDLVVTALNLIITRLEALDGTTVDAKVRVHETVYRNTVETEGSTHGDDGVVRHMGGLVMHSGGVIGAAMSNVLPFIPRAHSGLAVDEVPIIAQTGEGVLSRRGMAQIGGASGLNALNNGGGGSLDLVSAIRSLKDRPVVVELVVDGQRFTRTVVKPNLDAEWERGGEGRRRSKKALQVA